MIVSGHRFQEKELTGNKLETATGTKFGYACGNLTEISRILPFPAVPPSHGFELLKNVLLL
jgi:hypothetical protein